MAESGAKTLANIIEESYKAGFIAGVKAYAWKMDDGGEFVGSGMKVWGLKQPLMRPLDQALSKIENTWNYKVPGNVKRLKGE